MSATPSPQQGPTAAIRVMIVEDHFIMRMGFRTILDLQEDMRFVSEATTGKDALSVYLETKPDVVLMDLRLPGANGFEATAEILKTDPKAKIIAISTYDGEEDIHRALRLGASAYLTKSVLETELADAIRAIFRGRQYVPPVVAARLAERTHHPELSSRETEVLGCIVKGLSNKEIGAQLSISEATVKLHVGNTLAKLGVQDRTQASTVAIRRGIIHLD
jgi:DNA-binding NarL/FixJ family response regulator